MVGPALAMVRVVSTLLFLFTLVAAPPALDLNTATPAELQRLPGVGPKTAAAIVARRPFRRVRDLRKVKGIGPRRYRRLAPLVSVQRPPRATPLTRARQLACFPRRARPVRAEGCTFVSPRGVWTPP